MGLIRDFAMPLRVGSALKNKNNLRKGSIVTAPIRQPRAEFMLKDQDDDDDDKDEKKEKDDDEESDKQSPNELLTPTGGVTDRDVAESDADLEVSMFAYLTT